MPPPPATSGAAVVDPAAVDWPPPRPRALADAAAFPFLHALLACVTVALGFTGFDIYWAAELKGPPAAVFVVVLAVVALCLATLHRASYLAIRGNPLPVWAMAYVGISAAYLIPALAHETGLQYFGERVRGALFLLASAVLLASPTARHLSRRALAGVVVLSTLLNGVDILAPMTFSLVLDRAAGLYRNPNITGTAIVFALALCVDVYGPRWRPWLFVVAGIGILPTFSRAAFLMYGIVLVYYLWNRALSLRHVAPVFAFLVGLAWISGGFSYLANAVDQYDLLSEDAKGRFLFRSSDDSAQERFRVAAKAFDTFAEAPVLGNGLGASLDWEVTYASSHNMYLNMAVDHGLIGCGLMLWLLLAVMRFGGRSRLIGILVAILGFFSHNVLDLEPVLFSVALAVSMGLSERQRAASSASA